MATRKNSIENNRRPSSTFLLELPVLKTILINDVEMTNITSNEANHFVLRKQHLTDNSSPQDIVKIVENIGGLHATSSITPYLSLFARIKNFAKEHLDEEFYVKKSLGKIRCIRGTLYIFPKEMISLVYTATNKLVENQSRKALEFRGVSLEEYKKISKSIISILEDDKSKEMTASEIKKALQTKINISYILYLMCDQGLIIRSRPRKYSLFKEYFPDMNFSGINEQEAESQLVHYYLRAFGPASEEDIVWWTGLGKTKIINALNRIEDQFFHIKISDSDDKLMLLKSDKGLIEMINQANRNTINLLPILDPYLMGYKKRGRYFLSLKHYNFIFDRTGNATSTILINGRVIGVWDLGKDEKPLLKLFLFEKTEEEVLTEIQHKAKKIGEFITQKKVQLKECDFMIPLNERTAGSFMSPLKDCK